MLYTEITVYLLTEKLPPFLQLNILFCYEDTQIKHSLDCKPGFTAILQQVIYMQIYFGIELFCHHLTFWKLSVLISSTMVFL